MHTCFMYLCEELCMCIHMHTHTSALEEGDGFCLVGGLFQQLCLKGPEDQILYVCVGALLSGGIC